MHVRKLLTLALLGAAALAQAADKDHLRIEAPYARAVPPTAQNSGAFMVIHNESDRPVRLVDADSSVSKVTELHTHVNDDGVMRMRRVDFIEVPARGRVELRPGGYHVMLIGLERPLAPGDPVRIEFTLGDGSRLPVDLLARPTGMGHGMPMHGSGAMPMQHAVPE